MGRWWLLIPVLITLAMAGPACSEDFSSTNVQLLYGSRFDDRFLGNNTSDGHMTTLTIEHFGKWAYGDNYFFVDFLSGSFVDFSGASTGRTSRMYGEWAPRLSLSGIFQQDLGIAIFKDFYLAGQINADGEGFHAEMIGLGTDIMIPCFSVASLQAYLRKDNFNRATWQLTGVWSLPLGRYVSFDGFIDAYGSDAHGVEIVSQPQLLADAGALLSDAPARLQLGVEWYWHRNNRINSSVPQIMMKWTW